MEKKSHNSKESCLVSCPSYGILQNIEQLALKITFTFFIRTYMVIVSFFMNTNEHVENNTKH